MRDIVKLFLMLASDDNFTQNEIDGLIQSCNLSLHDSVYALVHMIIHWHAKRDKLVMLTAINKRWPTAILKDRMVVISVNEQDIPTLLLALENKILRCNSDDVRLITRILLSEFFVDVDGAFDITEALQ